MPFCTVTEVALLGQELGKTTPTIPTTHFMGLITALSRANTTVYTSGQYIINPTFPFSATSSTWSIFKCTTGGTSASSAPGGYAAGGAVGGTITDGTAVFTEASTLFAAGTFTGAEPATGAYARQSITNNTTNWPGPSGGDPAQVQNGAAINFPTTTASWGQLVGFVLFDAITAGNARLWGLLNAASAVATVVGVAPNVAISGVTVQLT